ncbi:ABC-type antimicrobial peptide transport system, permease component [Planctomycetales bacterium 10988]|nr:ABC-type antimicrobial peptide transport system, permease component [Planctomycetales bacterium 10988]
MSLWKIAWRSIQQRGIGSILTILSLSLTVMLVVVTILAYGVLGDYFNRNSQLGYNLLIGAKGSRLQLVMNSVYHLDQPIENVPWDFYEKFTTNGDWGKSEDIQIEHAIPLCLGDSYEGFRVVGTTPEMFDDFYYSQDHKYEFADGRNFKQNHFYEAVIGSLVAERLGFKAGDTFEPTHGVSGDGIVHDSFEIVGILKPTGTPNDRALFVNMEGFFLLEGHAKLPEDEEETEAADEGESETSETEEAPVGPEGEPILQPNGGVQPPPLPKSQREVTAILLRAPLFSAISLQHEINKGNVAQAVAPMRVIGKLMEEYVKPMRTLLLAMAIFIVGVSSLSVLIGIYNSMAQRKREIAIMRALGARRDLVMVIILCESLILNLAGGLFGWLLGHGLLQAMSPLIESYTGVMTGFFDFHLAELLLIPGMILLATIVGIIPALTAYRTDVADSLQTR